MFAAFLLLLVSTLCARSTGFQGYDSHNLQTNQQVNGLDNFLPQNTQRFTHNMNAGSVAMASPKQKLDWYKYLQRVFWRAGNYRGLRMIADVLPSLQISQQDRQQWEALMQKLNVRMALAQRLVTNPQYRDQVAQEVTALLITQGYPEARDFLKLQIGANMDMRQASDDINAVSLTIAMIQFDALYNRPKVPLWELHWGLKITEKIEVMNYANELRNTKNVSMLPRIDAYSHAVRARCMLIMKMQDIETILRDPEIAKRPVEVAMLTGYATVMQGDYCGAIRHFNEAAKFASIDAASDITAMIKKWQPKCREREESKTFMAFCQYGPGTEFPISEAAKKESNAKALLTLERLYWAAAWSGDCRVAFEQLEELKRTLSQTFLTSHPIVTERVAYMERTLTDCNRQNRPDARAPFDSPTGQTVLQALRANRPDDALMSARASGDPRLVFAVNLFRFSKAAYSPCMGGAVIGGPQDARVLDNVDLISRGQILPSCPVGEEKCNFQQLQAFYIAGSFMDVKRVAKLLSPSSQYCRPTVQMLACLELCSDPKNKENIAKALEHFNKQLETSQSNPAVNIGKHLAEKLLRPPKTFGSLDPVSSELNRGAPAQKKPSVFRQQIPMPVLAPTPMPLGSCVAGMSGAASPCAAVQAPCAQCAAKAPPSCACQQPTPCAQPQPCAQAPPPQVAQPPVAQPPTAQAPVTQATQALKNPCNCSGTSSIPTNPSTGKPWTPEDIKGVIEGDRKKKLKEALPLVKPIIAQKVAKMCEQNQKIFDDVLNKMKGALRCEECEKAKLEAQKAEALALATGESLPSLEDATEKKPEEAKKAEAAKSATPVAGTVPPAPEAKPVAGTPARSPEVKPV